MKKAFVVIIILVCIFVFLGGYILGYKSALWKNKEINSIDDTETKYIEYEETTVHKPDETIEYSNVNTTTMPAMQIFVPEENDQTTTTPSVKPEYETVPSQTAEMQESMASEEDTKPVYEGDSPLDAGEI